MPPFSIRPSVQLSKDEMSAAHAVVRRDLDLCLKALRKECRRADDETYVPEAVRASGADRTKPSILKRMTLDERAEYFLSRYPMAILAACAGPYACARFSALWRQHLPLGAMFARRFATILHLPFDDAFSHACEAIMVALARYDPAKAAFSTYIQEWVFHETYRDGMWHRMPMRIGPSALSRCRDPEATPEDASVLSYHSVGLDTRVPLRVLSTMLGVTPVRACAGLRLEYLRLSDTIPDAAAESAFVAVTESRDGGRMLGHIDASGLSANERHVLIARLDDDPPSLKEIGLSIGLSRERTRQLYNSAIGKIRRRSGIDRRSDGRKTCAT